MPAAFQDICAQASSAHIGLLDAYEVWVAKLCCLPLILAIVHVCFGLCHLHLRSLQLLTQAEQALVWLT